jgi:hypothetical protein
MVLIASLLFLILFAILFRDGFRFLLAVLLPALFGGFIAILLWAVLRA